jgi:hypothetical protein
LPDSFPSHAFNSRGVVVTKFPLGRTGIPTDGPTLHNDSKMTQERRDLGPDGQRFRFGLWGCTFLGMLRHKDHANNRPCGGSSNSMGLAHSGSSFCT